MNENLKKITKSRTFKIIVIVFAALINAININSFVDAGDLVPGGFTGVALLIQRICDNYFGLVVSFGLINVLLNSFPAFLAYKSVGKKFTFYSVLMIVLTSLFTDIIPNIPLTDDILLIAVFGGIINGLAVSLVLKVNASSGGTDFIAMYFSNKFNVSTWNYVLLFNATIILTAGALFGWDKALYSLIFQFCATVVIKQLHVRYQRCTLFIVTQDNDTLAKKLMDYTRHGVTTFVGTGSYTNREKTLLYMVVSSDEINDVMRFVRREDPKAFVNVTKSYQVDGNFYQRPFE